MNTARFATTAVAVVDRPALIALAGNIRRLAKRAAPRADHSQNAHELAA